MPKALDVARYFLSKAEPDQELISNLKLQKLLYYAQGIHLALYNKSLFPECIEAWDYGPVVPAIYHDYKRNGARGIPPDENFKPNSIDKKTRDFLDEIYEIFGQYSAVRLMEISHGDECWKNTASGNEITHEAMEKTMKKYLKK